jgi:hypothetical protein
MDLPVIDIFVDFDNTISEGNCQDKLFLYNLRRLNKKYEPLGCPIKCPNDYWKIINKLYGDSDREMAYLQRILDDIKDGTLLNKSDESISNSDLREFGKFIDLSKGFKDFIARTKLRWKDSFIIRFSIISLGIKELIIGSGIGEYVDNVFATTFLEKDGKIEQIHKLVTSFSKTSHIIEVVKGRHFNDKMRYEDYSGDYKNDFVIGDSVGDLSMFCYARKKGAKTIAVYKPGDAESYSSSVSSIGDRVDAIVPRDYSENSPIDMFINKIITKKLLNDDCTFPAELLHMARKRNIDHEETTQYINDHHNKCHKCQIGISTTFVES